MPPIKIRPLARRDISDSADYLESQSGLELAERFLSSVRAELESLSKMPEIGALCGFQSSEVRDVRRWAVSRFERWLIFYKPRDSGIEVVRVLHGAQDIHAIFD